MGIRFTTTSKSWRAPLRLIDSWLPASPVRPTPPLPASRAVQLFARAGWLKGSATRAPVSTPACNDAGRPPRLRLVRKPTGNHSNHLPDTRLVISGRISDVCAELDRLAALEPQAKAA